MATFRMTICLVLALALLATPGFAASLTDSLKAGKAELKSAGSLAFGPDGVLFVGDSLGGAIFAIDTQDRTVSQTASVEVKALSEKIAAMLGTTADQIQINDVAVNPISKKTYVSVSRGLGPAASPVILRIDSTGKLEALSLDNVKHSSVSLPNPANSSTTGSTRTIVRPASICRTPRRASATCSSGRPLARRMRSSARKHSSWLISEATPGCTTAGDAIAPG